MTRKLLPYEYDLIEALGVTKEEYLEFLAVQVQYSDPKEGTVLDVRNDPGTQALVLTIVGIIFQLLSVLLLPKPDVPGGRQSREERFSPRFGFNSAQELAKYGDVVPLVYTDRTVNKTGGVRVSGALLWSAVRSYGSNQFLQMLMMLAGGAITRIDEAKSAFGQTVISDLVSQNRWLYFDPGGTKFLKFSDEVDNKGDSDPTKYGKDDSNPYRLQPTAANTRVDGFSQAYSPTVSNVFGVYSPVPINLKTYLRRESGTKKSINLGITATGLAAWGPNTGRHGRINVGDTINIRIASTQNPPTGTKFDDDLVRSAMDARRTYASVFDDAGIFKLGSAKFKVTRISGTSTDEGDVTIKLTCIEKGNAPSLPYSYDEIDDLVELYKNDPRYKKGQILTRKLLELDDRDEYQGRSGWGRPFGVFEYDDGDQRMADSDLPSNQRFAVDSAETLLKSGQLWQVVSFSTAGWYNTRRSGETWKKVRNLSKNEKEVLRDYVEVKNDAPQSRDDLFYLKALVRIEEASYNTLTPCNIVDIALKCQVYRRISGRQQTYGSKGKKGYASSDNGIQQRTSMFLLRYRISEGNWTYVRGIFAVRRAAEQDNFVYLKFNGGDTPRHWQFKLEPISDPVAEIAERGDLRLSSGKVRYYYIQNSGDATTINLPGNQEIYFTGFYRDTTSTLELKQLPPINQSPAATNEWDLFSLDADTQLFTSLDNGPEFLITAVTEQQKEVFSDDIYKRLALVGFNTFSGKGVQDMRAFSVFATQGRSVRKLNTNTLSYPDDPNGPSCYAPDIFLDTVIDKQDGIGNYAKIEGINTEQLAKTKRFCIKNDLYMDCLIADSQNWREFWASTAPYSLLEFARVGGQETLIPSVPYNPETGDIDRKVNITALFNTGNILENSYKEEFMDYGANVQDVIATVIYRTLDSNGAFFVNKSVAVQLADTSETNAIRQTFDLSAFVTNEDQAIKFGKLVCNTRRHVRSAVEFKTYPTTSPISPGAYIYVDVGFNAWDSIRTGTIGPGGLLNMPLDNNNDFNNGNYSILLYRSGDGVVSTTATVTNGVASSLATREGWLFVLGTKVKQKRVYRVTDVEMDEEGEVTVRATIFPCDTDDRSLIADFSNSLFTVTR